MRKWNASMPRERAKKGEAHVVVAFKKDSGLRMEFEGTLTTEDAHTLMNQAIEMMKRRDGAQTQPEAKESK